MTAKEQQTPPHSNEAERAVIGAILTWRDSGFERVDGLVDQADFYSLQHAKIFGTAAELYECSIPIDIVTISNRIGGKLDIDISLLSQFADSCPTLENIEYYCDIIKKEAIRRNLILVLKEQAVLAYKSELPAEDEIALAIERISGCSRYRTKDSFTLGDIWPKFIEVLKDRKKRSFSPVPTGVPSLNVILGGGLERGQVSLLCAPPGSGKTSMAVDWGFNFAADYHGPTIFWSLEMSKWDILSRIVSQGCEIPWSEVRRGEHIAQCASLGKEAEETPFIVCTRKDCYSIRDFERFALHVGSKYGQVPFAIIDYVQLLASTKVSEMRQAAEDVSSEILSMANRLEMPVLALSSVNRGSYNLLKGNQPNLHKMLSMAKESGKFESDAAVVLGIARIQEDDEDPRCQKAWIGVAKNRLSGGVGAVSVVFDGLSGVFTEIDPDRFIRSTSKTRECKDRIKQAIRTAASNGAPINTVTALQDYVSVRRQFLCDCLAELMNDGEIIKSDGIYKLTT